MESSLKQFISSTNGTNHDHPELSTSPKSSPPPASPKKASALPPKIPLLTPHTQLTGEAALANRDRSQSPRHIMSDDKDTKRDRPQETPVDTQVSPNPAAAVLSNYPMSRPTDVPNREDSPASHKGLAALPSIATAANAMDTSGGSPNTATSMTTNGSAGDSSATPATAGPGGTTDPALLHPNDTNHPSYQPIGLQNRSNSLSEQFSATTPTTPGGFAQTPTTPYSPSTPGGSRGKHTCHHCNQTFTRHHNLKSHLLTHSHEKPFLCSTCQARFRRLHDLKRHSKLHTGERPHVCNKCGRKFARGDALARHARAEGGCAGRRSSMAGMLNEDGSIVQGLSVDQEDGMEGLEGLIGADPDGDVDMMGSDGGSGGSRRRSLPSIRTDFTSSGNAPGNPITPASGASGFGHTPTPIHGNTYPPLNTPRNTASTSGPSPASGASLFASHLVKPNTSSATSPMQTTAATVASATPTSGVTATGGSIISPHGILSDSPRASSPSAMAQEASGRDRTPSFGFMTGLTPTSHAPPQQQQQPQQSQPQPPQQSAPQREAPTGAPTANMGGGPVPSHTNNMFTSPEAMWGYIKSLEDRIRSLEATVAELKQERQNLPQAQQQRPAVSNTSNQESSS